MFLHADGRSPRSELRSSFLLMWTCPHHVQRFFVLYGTEQVYVKPGGSPHEENSRLSHLTYDVRYSQEQSSVSCCPLANFVFFVARLFPGQG